MLISAEENTYICTEFPFSGVPVRLRDFLSRRLACAVRAAVSVCTGADNPSLAFRTCAPCIHTCTEQPAYIYIMYTTKAAPHLPHTLA